MSLRAMLIGKFRTAKPLLFLYRAARNALSALPWARRMLFPQQVLAARFGPDDLMYGIGVFERHLSRLKKAGASSATDILEIGPGRNLATGILMLCEFQERATSSAVKLTYWDVFANVEVSPEIIREVASSLANGIVADRLRASPFDGWKTLGRVASGSFLPEVRYVVAPMEKFFHGRNPPSCFDLVYSQAAIEHIWKIRRFWQLIMQSTCPGGWHSHRIDLADHGKRHTNYIEMLEWSDFAHWMTQRFIPGAINRFRYLIISKLSARVVDISWTFRGQ